MISLIQVIKKPRLIENNWWLSEVEVGLTQWVKETHRCNYNWWKSTELRLSFNLACAAYSLNPRTKHLLAVTLCLLICEICHTKFFLQQPHEKIFSVFPLECTTWLLKFDILRCVFESS